ncbi:MULTISPECIES: ATP-binding protein [unclassified Paenibacillus]|uniref:sensor histidine kinase n=1 Tax=unclassified Paenibacillus TaxID=185978 RepID=UPI001AE8D1D3|nr:MULTISPECIES: ATP-binding protein [unclassified Paenibacillus]MBP1154447.1 signal transduction histidine kinase [Paenibacillus sp. PvP091]MBP1170169.1 signal transduction histidine kinase [Paenibacillus sp. PvR098]MBP2441197.1 signal transduction histidine kinase [Paenibacillus sp. PvP052]
MPSQRIYYPRFTAFILLSLILALVLYLEGSRFFSSVSSPPEADKGVLDLQSWDWQQHESVPLSGQWEFFWNRLVPPDELTGDSDPLARSYSAIPGAWNGMQMDGEALPGEGFATYRLKVLLPEKDDHQLALWIPTMNTSYRLWVNGQEIASVGTVGTSKLDSKPQYITQVAVANAQHAQLDVVLQISNYFHQRGGILKPIELGEVESIVRTKELFSGFDTLLIGSLLIMGLYHLGVFAVRTKELSMLFFGLFCLLVSLRVSLLGEIVLTRAFPGFYWMLLIKLEYLTASLGVPLFILFFSNLFPCESSRKINLGLCASMFAFSLFIMMSPTMVFTKALVVLQLMMLAAIVYIMRIVALAFIRQREGSGIILLACFIFSVTIVNDMLYAHELVRTTDQMSGYGLLIFVFSQSMLLSTKWSRAYMNEEKLSAALTELNSSLHDKIKSRTSDLEQANEALKQKNDELSRLENSRSHLLSNVSHDLGTPLTTIQCYVEAIMDGMVDTEEQKARYLQIIHSKVVGMDRLIEDLFHLSQLEARQVVFKKKPMRTDHLTELLYTRYELDTRNAGLHYKLNLKRASDGQGMFSIIEVDLERMHQVFGNLIHNSIKFTPEGGSIDVEMIDDGHCMLCRISDSGHGINPADLPYVFDRFYTNNKSRNLETGGKGLGLSISKEIVEYHGGRIWVESSGQGKGTVISFSLPSVHD